MLYALACREELRGKKSKCNGGGYDGCACGRYNEKDLAEVERRKKVSEAT